MKRRDARESAFLLVFEYDFNKDIEPQAIIETALEERELETDEFSKSLFNFVVENLGEIDAKIDACIKNYSANRITKTARSVLRLAVGEHMMGETEGAIIANAAVELAKKFDTEDAAAYVNGVLGAYLGK